MGVCERMVLFEHRYGQRRSAQQRKNMAQGGREHRRLFQEGLVQPQPVCKGACFIVILLHGNGYEVTVLRAFRERVLCRSMLGQGVILAYCRVTLDKCRMLHLWLIRAMRALLRPAVWVTARLERWRAGR